jgi:hypothetical protein
MATVLGYKSRAVSRIVLERHTPFTLLSFPRNDLVTSRLLARRCRRRGAGGTNIQRKGHGGAGTGLCCPTSLSPELRHAAGDDQGESGVLRDGKGAPTDTPALPLAPGQNKAVSKHKIQYYPGQGVKKEAKLTKNLSSFKDLSRVEHDHYLGQNYRLRKSQSVSAA